MLSTLAPEIPEHPNQVARGRLTLHWEDAAIHATVNATRSRGLPRAVGPHIPTSGDKYEANLLDVSFGH